MFENLRSGQILSRWFQQKEQTRLTTGYYQFLYSPRNPDYDRNLRSLREIVQLCEARQVPLIIAVFPVLYDLERYPFGPLHNQVRDIVREASKAPTTRFVDLLDSLAHYPAGNLWVHPTDHHPNEVAHAEIASALFQELKQLLPDTRG